MSSNPFLFALLLAKAALLTGLGPGIALAAAWEWWSERNQKVLRRGELVEMGAGRKERRAA